MSDARRIDLNCDLGEGAGHDAELMPLITSANVACGAHAGDEATMRATVRLATRWGVAVGAHPGFADRENFGRTERTVSPEEVYRLLSEQTERLQAIARAESARVVHLKPHGALYNRIAREAPLAEAAARVAADFDLVLFALAGSVAETIARERGVRVAAEIFADRRYRAEGSLVPRTEPGALIECADEAAAQVLRFLGSARLRVDTVCVHGDGARAVEFARRLRLELAGGGVSVGGVFP